jgi:hypothetical protein
MILPHDDLGPRSEPLTIPSGLLSVRGACVSDAANRAAFHDRQTHRLTLPTPPTLLTPKQDGHRPAVTTRDRSRITSRFASDRGNSWRLRLNEEAPGLGAHRNLDGNHHPQRSWQTLQDQHVPRAFKITLGALTRR